MVVPAHIRLHEGSTPSTATKENVMGRLRFYIVFLITWLIIVVVGGQFSMYLDSKFYGEARAEQVENWDDSQYHYEMMLYRKAQLNYQVIFTFPDYDNDTTRLVVVYHPENDMHCYVLENRPYNFKTGLNCFPGWYIRGEHLK